MTIPNNDLTPEEHSFRNLLLDAAKRLDVPSDASVSTAIARVESRARRQVGRWVVPFTRHGVLLSCVGLAAGVFLYLRSERSTPNVVLKAESIVPTPPPKARAVTAPSVPVPSVDDATRAVPIPSAVKLRVPVAKPRRANVTAPDETPRLRIASPSLLTLQAQATERLESGNANAVSLIVWDGDKFGLSASGWSGPDKTEKTIAVVPNTGFARSNGLVWQAQGDEWMGFGWNWFSWWPSNAGTDISRHRQLVFRLRIEAKVPEQRPEPKGFLVTLSSSTGTGKRSTRTVPFARNAYGDLVNGEWHNVTVPLSELVDRENARGFDAKHAWEFDLGYWSRKPTTFTAYVDDIGFE